MSGSCTDAGQDSDLVFDPPGRKRGGLDEQLLDVLLHVQRDTPTLLS